HLLRSGELLGLLGGRMQIVAYEHGLVGNDECPGVKQRVCAVNDHAPTAEADAEPPPHSLNDGA
ncbi:MAG: SAM-dependent methyltransferase, partial [Proteobacteria bacterium]|nr:SAM-dependent methyltransferase [Pseudomonadota bacterium]